MASLCMAKSIAAGVLVDQEGGACDRRIFASSASACTVLLDTCFPFHFAVRAELEAR